MKLDTYTQDKINRISYKEVQNKLKCLYKDLELCTTKEQKNYLEMEILVQEEFLANILSRGRR